MRRSGAIRLFRSFGRRKAVRADFRASEAFESNLQSRAYRQLVTFPRAQSIRGLAQCQCGRLG